MTAGANNLWAARDKHIQEMIDRSLRAYKPDLSLATGELNSTRYPTPTGNAPGGYTPSAHTHPWSDITGTPTTLAGYGITNAYTKTESDALYAPLSHTHPYTALTYSGLTAGQVLRATGATAAAFGALDLENGSAVTGILSPANGGTGVDNDTRTLMINTNGGALTFSAASSTLTIPASGTAALRASAATAGRVAFWSSATEISHESALFWDTSSKFLGVNKASPAVALDVGGIIQSSSMVRIQGVTPGFWLDETDGAVKGAFFVLDGGLMQLQRRATGFGSSEATLIGIDISGPANVIRSSSNGSVGIGKVAGLTGAGDLDVSGVINGDEHIQLREITAPSAPAANKGVLYLEDNGSGKTRLVVKFNSGAAQVIATQP